MDFRRLNVFLITRRTDGIEWYLKIIYVNTISLQAVVHLGHMPWALTKRKEYT
jgi:hypothetical protein